jgi:mono/diheme cytochrome c family protein
MHLMTMMLACTLSQPPEVPLSEQARRGRGSYLGTCATCHQPDGTGLKGAFPPLAGSEWVTGPPTVPIRIVLSGLQGPITVAGDSYSSVMLSHRESLSDEQVADILTYVRTAWGNASPPVTTAEVAAVRAETADRAAAWTAEELNR